VTAYALIRLQDRGSFFVEPTQETYEGQVVGGDPPGGGSGSIRSYQPPPGPRRRPALSTASAGMMRASTWPTPTAGSSPQTPASPCDGCAAGP